MVKSTGLNTNRFLTPDTIVPDPANPQSLNRYSYGYNNPVKYYDPDGHAPTDGCNYEGCSLTVEERRQSINIYTNLLLEQRERIGLTDVDIIAHVMDFAAGYNTSVQEWADDITSVVNGTTGVLTLLTAAPGEETPQFGDSGFHPIYQDEQNQVYHWWAYVNSTVQGGEIGANVIGHLANEVHEFWDFRETFRQPATGSPWEDYALSENGMAFGLSIYYGYTTPDNAANADRYMLTTDLQRPIVRWMGDHIGNDLIPTNILRNTIEGLP